MKLFDDVIRQALALVEPFGAVPCPACPAAREGDPNELILRRDMAFELGEGSFPAVSLTTITQDKSLVPEDGVYLLGPDLPEIKGDCAFARLTFLRTGNVYQHGEQATYNLIKALENRKFHASPAGYMMQPAAMSNREQVRVSKKAVKTGLRFQDVGSLLIRKYRENPMVHAVSIIFITLPQAPYDELNRLCDQVNSITKTLNHALLDVSMDCRACEWKPVCDAVDGMRELHQKQLEKKEEHT